MKGLRPLHASQELKRGFFDRLNRAVIKSGSVFLTLFILLHADIPPARELKEQQQGQHARHRQHGRVRGGIAEAIADDLGIDRNSQGLCGAAIQHDRRGQLADDRYPAHNRARDYAGHHHGQRYLG